MNESIPSSTVLSEFNDHISKFEQGLQNQALLNLKKYYPETHSLSSLRALKLAVQLGLNTNQSQVSDFINWLSTDAGLPDENRLAFEGMVNMDPSPVIDSLNKRIDVAKQKIAAMAQASDLRPRTDEIDNLLRRLEALNR
jgi:hypothetical protein